VEFYSRDLHAHTLHLSEQTGICAEVAASRAHKEVTKFLILNSKIY